MVSPIQPAALASVYHHLKPLYSLQISFSEHACAYIQSIRIPSIYVCETQKPSVAVRRKPHADVLKAIADSCRCLHNRQAEAGSNGRGSGSCRVPPKLFTRESLIGTSRSRSVHLCHTRRNVGFTHNTPSTCAGIQHSLRETMEIASLACLSCRLGSNSGILAPTRLHATQEGVYCGASSRVGHPRRGEGRGVLPEPARKQPFNLHLLRHCEPRIWSRSCWYHYTKVNPCLRMAYRWRSG